VLDVGRQSSKGQVSYIISQCVSLIPVALSSHAKQITPMDRTRTAGMQRRCAAPSWGRDPAMNFECGGSHRVGATALWRTLLYACELFMVPASRKRQSDRLA
jgi:hypothetical protein